jgi:hypothetical protein
MRVFVLDRIFDRDDMLGIAAIDLIDQCGERRRLSRSGWTAD